MYVYYQAKVSFRSRHKSVLLLLRLGMGFLGPLRRRDRALRALWRVEAAASVLGGRSHLRYPLRYRSQGIPVYFSGLAARHDVGRHRFDDGGRLAGEEARPSSGPARADRRRAARPGLSPHSLWRRRRTGSGSGSAPAARSWRCARSTRTRKRAASAFIPASCGGGRRATPVYAPASHCSTPATPRTPIAPGAYNYVISLQPRSKESGHPPLDLPVDFASLGYQQVQCWTDPYDRAMSLERICLWRRAGTCDSRSAKPLTPDVGEAFEELTR